MRTINFALLPLIVSLFSACGPTGPEPIGEPCFNSEDVTECHTLGPNFFPWCCTGHGGDPTIQCDQPAACVASPGNLGANYCCPGTP